MNLWKLSLQDYCHLGRCNGFIPATRPGHGLDFLVGAFAGMRYTRRMDELTRDHGLQQPTNA